MHQWYSAAQALRWFSSALRTKFLCTKFGPWGHAWSGPRCSGGHLVLFSPATLVISFQFLEWFPHFPKTGPFHIPFPAPLMVFPAYRICLHLLSLKFKRNLPWRWSARHASLCFCGHVTLSSYSASSWGPRRLCLGLPQGSQDNLPNHICSISIDIWGCRHLWRQGDIILSTKLRIHYSLLRKVVREISLFWKHFHTQSASKPGT